VERHKITRSSTKHDQFRVQSVTIPAGTEEPYHDHPTVGFSGRYSEYRHGPRSHWQGNSTDRNGPSVIVQPPQGLHSIKNSGTTDGHLIRIEFKKGFFTKLIVLSLATTYDLARHHGTESHPLFGFILDNL